MFEQGFRKFVIGCIGALTMSSPVFAQEPARPTTGDLRVAVVLAKFQDSPATLPFTAAQLQSRIFNGPLKAWYDEVSYGKARIVGNVFDWKTLPRSEKVNGSCALFSDPSPAYQPELASLIQDNSIDVGAYDYVIYLAHHTQNCSFGSGAANRYLPLLQGGQKPIAIVFGNLGRFTSPIGFDPSHPFPWSDFETLLAHEMAHNLGITYHAGGLECGTGQTLYAPSCNVIEYGNLFDAVGDNLGTISFHHNARIKEQLGWLDSSSLLNIGSAGTATYTLKPLESGTGFRAAKITPIGYDYAPFYLEFRRATGFDGDLAEPDVISNQSGLMVNLVVPNRAYPLLLDMRPTSNIWTPTSPSYDAINVTLNSGVFTDPARGLTIGPIKSVSSSGITFDVTLSTPTCVRNAPNTSVSANKMLPGRGSDEFGTFYYLTRGTSRQIQLDVWNRDGRACGSSDFEVLLDAPAGLNPQVLLPGTTPRVTVASEKISNIFGVDIPVPQDTEPGDYPIKIQARNTAGGEPGTLANFRLLVLPEGPITPPEKPTIQPASGTYAGQVAVSMTPPSTPLGTYVAYTLDGTDPKTSPTATRCGGPSGTPCEFTLQSSKTLKAISRKSLFGSSQVEQRDYIVTNAPAITQQPTDQTRRHGTWYVAFEVRAAGAGTLAYQWQSKTPAQTSWTTISGATGTTYSPPASATNGTRFRCRVSNSIGTIYSNEAALWINNAPIANAGPDKTGTFFDSVELQGTMTDDGLPTPPGGLIVEWSKASGPGSVEFTAPNMPQTDATFSEPGTYDIRFKANDGTLEGSDTARVVIDAPHFETPPASPSELTATVSSNSAIQLYWQDQSGDETGFRIERGSSAQGPFAVVASLGASSTSYLDSGLVPGSYAYRVLSTRGTILSNPSNVAVATIAIPDEPVGSWNWLSNGNTVTDRSQTVRLIAPPPGTTKLAFAVWSGEIDRTLQGDRGNYSVELSDTTCSIVGPSPWTALYRPRTECYVVTNVNSDWRLEDRTPTGTYRGSNGCNVRYTASSQTIELVDRESLKDCGLAVFTFSGGVVETPPDNNPPTNPPTEGPPTNTPSEDPSDAAAVGPVVTFFGPVSASGAKAPLLAGTSNVFVRTPGSAFRLVVEAKAGANAKRPGSRLNTSGDQDLEVILDQPLGDLPASSPFTFSDASKIRRASMIFRALKITSSYLGSGSQAQYHAPNQDTGAYFRLGNNQRITLRVRVRDQQGILGPSKTIVIVSNASLAQGPNLRQANTSSGAKLSQDEKKVDKKKKKKKKRAKNSRKKSHR